MRFKRKDRENIDEVFSRFELTMERAVALASFVIGSQVVSWLLLEALQVPYLQFVATHLAAIRRQLPS